MGIFTEKNRMKFIDWILNAESVEMLGFTGITNELQPIKIITSSFELEYWSKFESIGTIFTIKIMDDLSGLRKRELKDEKSIESVKTLIW